MRFDRTISLNFALSLQRFLPRANEVSLPILMYHGITNESKSDLHPYYLTSTSPEVFAKQIAFLKESGWKGVSLTGGLEWLASRETSSGNLIHEEKCVAVTFDDGFGDFYKIAAPILKKEGFSATMYLPSSFISKTPKTFNGHECMTWDEVRELRREGFEFGSHTVTHPQLADLSWSSVIEEIKNSKSEIECHLGESITAFAYPYAFPQARPAFVSRLVELLRNEGYRSNVTTNVGRARSDDNPFLCPRLPVNDFDDNRFLAAKLAGAYDWIARPQRIFKGMKTLFKGQSLTTY